MAVTGGARPWVSVSPCWTSPRGVVDMSSTDTITPSEIRAELASRFPKLNVQEIEELTAVFVQLAGGKYVTGKRLEKARRDAAICKLFDGSNLRNLARQFHLSLRHLRRVIGGK